MSVSSRSRHRTVVSFLSPSSVASRVAQEKLASLLGWNNTNATDPNNDQAWDRVAVECPHSGTILQWLAMDTRSDKPVSSKHPFGLLAVQQATSAAEATHALQASLAATSSTGRMTLKRWTGQSVTIKDLLGKHALPVLQWKDDDDDDDDQESPNASSSSSSSLFTHGV